MQLSSLLRLPDEKIKLTQIDANACPGWGEGSAAAARSQLTDARFIEQLRLRQAQLFAQGYTGAKRRVLLILQGMNAAGKSTTLDAVAPLLRPSILQVKSFKQPTAEELRFDFLWRVKRALPRAGEIGIFIRSHYEDILTARVHQLADSEELERRYAAINEWEQSLTKQGTVLLKCFLHIDAAEQKQRYLDRLSNPEQRWVFNPSDIDERVMWPAHQEAYELALSRCQSETAPWYLIPSNNPLYRDWAVANLLLEALESLEPEWPAPEFDPLEQQHRLIDQDPLEQARKRSQ